MPAELAEVGWGYSPSLIRPEKVLHAKPYRFQAKGEEQNVKKEDKVTNLDELKVLFDGAQAVFVTHYRGLTVKQMNALRRSMDNTGAKYRVAKNTLARLASVGTHCEPLGDDMTGPVGYVFVNGDPAAVAKALCAFAKTSDKFTIVAGALGGKRLSAADVEALSKLPSREQMLSMVVGVMQAPVRDFVGVLAAVPRSIVQVLSAIEDKKKAA